MRHEAYDGRDGANQRREEGRQHKAEFDRYAQFHRLYLGTHRGVLCGLPLFRFAQGRPHRGVLCLDFRLQAINPAFQPVFRLAQGSLGGCLQTFDVRLGGFGQTVDANSQAVNVGLVCRGQPIDVSLGGDFGGGHGFGHGFGNIVGLLAIEARGFQFARQSQRVKGNGKRHGKCS